MRHAQRNCQEIVVGSLIISIFLAQQLGEATAAVCVCPNMEEFRQASANLSNALDIERQKLQHSIQLIIANGHKNEQQRSLSQLEFSLTRQLQLLHQKIFSNTKVEVIIRNFIDSLKRQLSDTTYHNSIARVVEDFLNSICQATFVCLSLGDCPQVDPAFANCLFDHPHIFRDLIKPFVVLAENEIRELMKHNMEIWRTLKEFSSNFNKLPNEKLIPRQCIGSYGTVRHCRCDGNAVFCRSSCLQSLESCTVQLKEHFGSSWKVVMKSLQDKDYSINNVTRLVVAVLNKIVLKGPKIAVKLKEKCGAMQFATSPYESANFSRSVPLLHIDATFEQQISEISERLTNWRIFAASACANERAARTTDTCWNGTHTVRSREQDFPPDENDLEFSKLTKDVRPRPVEPWLEGSGNSKGGSHWNVDDEDGDLPEASGSGAPPPDMEVMRSDHEQTRHPTPAKNVSSRRGSSSGSSRYHPRVVIENYQQPDSARLLISYSSLLNFFIAFIVYLYYLKN